MGSPEPPRPRIEAIRIVDMSASNSWAEFAALFRNTRSAFLDHERAKSELKALMPEDAKEAIGHGVGQPRGTGNGRGRGSTKSEAHVILDSTQSAQLRDKLLIEVRIEIILARDANQREQSVAASVG